MREEIAARVEELSTRLVMVNIGNMSEKEKNTQSSDSTCTKIHPGKRCPGMSTKGTVIAAGSNTKPGVKSRTGGIEALYYCPETTTGPNPMHQVEFNEHRKLCKHCLYRRTHPATE